MTTTHPGRIQRSLEFAQDSKVHVCSCSELMDLVEPESLDAVFTDPPTRRSSWAAGTTCADWQTMRSGPGDWSSHSRGTCICPKSCAGSPSRGPSDTDGWALSSGGPRGGCSTVPKVSNGWKPFLAYSKPRTRPRLLRGRCVPGRPITRSTQAKHVWGQDQALMNELAKEWLQPGWRVADPFCGAGSLLFAAQETGCSVLGCDTDPDHVNTTRGKLT